MKTTDQQVLEWSAIAGSSFQFLERRGYARQAPELSAALGSASYLGVKLGVRLQVETDGFFMFVALFRVGHPDYGSTLYLHECPKLLGLPAGGQKELLSLRGSFSNCNRMLEILADSLAANLESIESAVDQLFPE